MTREQVLEIIENHRFRIPLTVFYDLKADILNFEEPITKNDLGVDCISRAEAIRVASGYCHPSNIAKELAKLPSVTSQEPKTGHWIANAPQYDMLNPQYICSECGNAHTRTTPYCEMCGADMRGEE